LQRAREKVRQATESLTRLDSSINEFFNEHPFRVIEAERHTRTGGRILRVVSDGVLVPEDAWAVHVGGIAHDLRSALGSLACQASRLMDRAIDCTATEFPIYLHGPESKRKPRFSRDHRAIAAMSKGHKALVEGAQPYRRGNGNARSPLWQLHELNNIDKHRISFSVLPRGNRLAIGIFPGQSRSYLGEARLTAGVNLVPNAKIGFVKESMNVRFWIFPHVVFRDVPCLDRESVTESLRRMCVAVADLLDLFAPEFREAGGEDG
jgi:hypothetical protein